MIQCFLQVQIEDVKKKTRRLLRKIIETTQSLSDQSDDVFITVLLKWNPDTPRDYEPSGFGPAKYRFNLHKSGESEAKVGSVKTNFHAVATKIRYISGHLKKLSQKSVQIMKLSEFRYSHLRIKLCDFSSFKSPSFLFLGPLKESLTFNNLSLCLPLKAVRLSGP